MEISCPICHAKFQLAEPAKDSSARFCMACGSKLAINQPQTQPDSPASTSESGSSSTVTLVAGHLPHNEQIQFSIGSYQILGSIGKGGMGEVYLAYDTSCGRRIALKRIRSDLVEHQQMHNRFLKEARVTSQLTHPAIIAIYEIHDERQLAYYTMPYVEGKTLKQMLKEARIKEKKGLKPDHSSASIPSLIRIFLSVCQAVGYAHSKSVLHRDIKPENIIVGKYGEVLILDWGLAKLIHGEYKRDEGIGVPDDFTEKSESELLGLTNLGKVVGTVSYMAPERAWGNPATVQTDIYSLGVILYQILTLRYPFHRKSLKEFRKNLENEQPIPPAVIAPHRDVPEILAQISMKCLSKDPLQRYLSVDELLYQLESYIEGRPEWFVVAELDISKKSDWEFQENVLIAEHIAITQAPEISDWVNLMISKESFDQNTRIEAELYLGDKSNGLGFLLSIPEAAERAHLNDGYTLWLGSDLNPTKLLRSTVEVLYAPEVFLPRHQWHRIRIEKVDNHINYYLNGSLQFSYLELLPMIGTHVGLLSRDGDFKLKNLKISVGGHNITINCLAVPDAFLAHKDYTTALSEYRRIGNSFPGRAEGREALFRAGITLLEQAKNAPTGAEKEQLYEKAFAQLEKLHNGAGAPLEYLGKALVYQSMGDYEEEVKCFELALRRYPRHPLLGALKEQIIYRMHESSRYSRSLTYKFVLLVVRLMPEAAASPSAKNLFDSLNRHWESLYFFVEELNGIKDLIFATKLAFWLAKPHTLEEIISETLSIDPFSMKCAANAIFCLIELGAWRMADQALSKIQLKEDLDAEMQKSLDLLNIAVLANKKSSIEATSAIHQLPAHHFNKQYDRLILYLMKKTLDEDDTENFHLLSSNLSKSTLAPDNELQGNCCRIWAALSEGNCRLAGEILHGYPLELLTNESSLLHFLYGCWLYVTEGPEIASVHFSSIFDHSTPRSWSLFSHYYNGKIGQSWYSKAFLWERKQLYRQMTLFYHCSGDENLATNYRRLAQETSIEE